MSEPNVLHLMDEMRTHYLRELTGLSKVLIILAAGTLGLLLSPFGVEISSRSGIKLILPVWALLLLSTVLGVVHMFLFSMRFKTKADILWATHMVDSLVQIRAEDEKLDEFLWKADRQDKRYKRQYRTCVSLVLGQTVLLVAAFVVLASCMYVIVVSACRACDLVQRSRVTGLDIRAMAIAILHLT